MLRQVPLFSGVAPAKLKLLAFTSDRVTYAPGQMLFQAGRCRRRRLCRAVRQGRGDGRFRRAARSRSPRWSRTRSSARSPSCATCRAPRPCAPRRRSRRCASARTISCGCSREYPEMTVEIMRVLADRLSHTTAELTEERSKHRRNPVAGRPRSACASRGLRRSEYRVVARCGEFAALA